MECENYFSQLLTRREYSARELQKKGQEKGFTEEEIAAAIGDLQSKGFQSDARLVETAIASGTGKYGKAAIRRKCMEKGIDSELFEEMWQAQAETEDPSDLENLKAKVARKYKISDFSRIEPKTKAKVWNYLQYRGFNPGEVLARWREEL